MSVLLPLWRRELAAHVLSPVGYIIAVLFLVLMMCTYIPAIPMFLVEFFYR